MTCTALVVYSIPISSQVREVQKLLRGGAATAADPLLRRRAIKLARQSGGVNAANVVGNYLWRCLAEARYRELVLQQRAAQERHLRNLEMEARQRHADHCREEAPRRRLSATETYAAALRGAGAVAESLGRTFLRVHVPEEAAAKAAWEAAVQEALRGGGYVPPEDLTLFWGSEAGWQELGWTTGLTTPPPEAATSEYQGLHWRPWYIVQESPAVQAALRAWRAFQAQSSTLERPRLSWRGQYPYENRAYPSLPVALETHWQKWSASLEEIEVWEKTVPQETGMILVG